MAKQTYTTGQVLTAAQMTTLQANDYNWTVSPKTANYTLVSADAGTRITMTNASATTITVNTGVFTAGDVVEIVNLGAGVLTITAGTATVNTSATLALKQYDAGSLWFSATGAAVFFSADAADSPLTTKGDLYTYSTTNDRLAVGNNGETLVADSSTSTGLRWQGHIEAGKNYIINGGFDVWQRGTSFASTSGYWADRWSNEGVLNAVTGSQQTTGAPDGSRYYGRLTSTGGSSYWSNKTKIETMNTSQLWGRTVTLSVKLRRNSTYASTGVLVYLEKSATVDAGSGASWAALGSRTSVATASIPTGTTSADWYTATVTTTVPNDGTANTIQVVIEYNGAVANGSILEIAQCQLELGSVPTTFSRAGGTIQGELAACQRYYERATAGNAYEVFAQGWATSSTNLRATYYYRVPKRVAATSLDFSTLRTSANVAVSNVTADALGNYSATINAVSSGMTTNTFYTLLADNSTNAYLGFSAEL